MSKTRQSQEPSVRGYSVTHPSGSIALPIEGGWNQFIYADRGVMRVTTQTGHWTIPSHRAIWIPDGEPATVTNSAPLALRTLYFSRAIDVFPSVVRAVNVASFAREMVLHAVRSCPLYREIEVDAALVTVLVDQLRKLPDEGLQLPWPTDPRAVDAANRIVGDPTVDLSALAHHVSTSRRTLERSFASETALSLGAWRRRAVILSSLELLSAGRSVTDTASALGYSAPSAFVLAFKQELGLTPLRYLSR
jgi:AraC-like DNA-binding protein